MFWQRTFGVLLIAVGIAGLTQSVQDWRVTEQVEPRVHVFEHGRLAPALTWAQAHEEFGESIPVIGGTGLVVSPNLQVHFEYLDMDSQRIVPGLEEWQKLCDRLEVGFQDPFVVACRGLLFQLHGFEATEGNEYGQGMLVDVLYLGRLAGQEREYPFAVITKQQFAMYPAIQQKLDAWRAYVGDGPVPEHLPIDVWKGFQDALIGSRDQFAVDETLYASEQTDDIVETKVSLVGLSIVFKIVSTVCLLVGVCLLAKAYRTAHAKAGIHVAGSGFAAFGDTANVVCMAVCAFVWIDVLLVHGLGQPGGVSVLSQLWLDDDLRHWPAHQRDAVYFGFTVGVLLAPALSALVTQRSGQAIKADEQGVTSDGGFGMYFIPWAEVEVVVVEEEYLPMYRMGLLLPRRLQKKLVLRGASRELSINAPATSGTKRRIVDLLVKYAPSWLASEIHVVSKTW